MAKDTKPRTKRYKAAEGRTVVFPLDTLAGPGRRPKVLTDDGEIVELPWNDAFARRRAKAGDLVEVSSVDLPSAKRGEVRTAGMVKPKSDIAEG